jgi:hypothetical protein
MRKIYVLTILLGFLATGFNTVQAQEFAWPDLGDALVITPGAPGVINQTIMGDTSATGERLHNHYVLLRGQTYLYTARIENDGYPLMVTAEDGPGEPPIIKPLGPAEGQEEAERPFHSGGDLYLKDLTLVGWDQGGNYTDNATVRLAADGITVVLKNINFDFNRQNSIRINAKDCKLYVENSIFGNQGVSQRLFQGFAVAFRGNYTPIVHLRNNTIYNMHNEVINNGSPARYNKLIMENNTIVNTGTGGSYFGRPDSLIVRNNLWVNVGVMGDGFLGDRDDFAEPHYYMVIDSSFSDDAEPVLVTPYVDFDYNYYYLDPAVAALLPDSSDKSTETMFHPYLADLAGDNNEVLDEAFTFTNFPATVNEYQSYITDFYNFAETPAQMPQFDTDFRVFDFSYPTSHTAYTAASDGLPLGDRNWFGIVSVNSREFEKFSVYPNPVENVLKLDLNHDQKITRVVISNVLGQTMKDVNGLSGTSINISTSDLESGIYFVKFYENSELKGASKILKK